ncbi:MAG: CDP-alcohol phosphatidyltransferase family protein [Planctomycetes bacterium]|nr:CDP-alcohol phosphatidyltransferase family protein [Planctomycetota bacterium]
MPSLSDLEARCQKPHWREVGSLLARRLARPLALYLTWLVVRWPVSANAVTSLALLVGLASAGLLGVQSAGGFMAGVGLLLFWYLLDHVDGQVARYRRSQSVTGLYLDFMMHHVVHPACAFALGYRVAALTGEPAWTLAGAGFAMGLVILAVSNDCKYKAFFGSGQRRPGVLVEQASSLPGRPEPHLSLRKSFSVGPLVTDRPLTPTLSLGGKRESCWVRHFASWAGPFASLFRIIHSLHFVMRQACEIPNVIVVLTLVAVLTEFDPSAGLGITAGYLLLMSVLAPLLGLARVAKQVYLRLPDAEFLKLETRGDQPSTQFPTSGNRADPVFTQGRSASEATQSSAY